MRNILWITNIPSPYKIDFFNELGSFYSLKVLFERKESSERKKSWHSENFSHFSPFFMRGLQYGKDKMLSFSFLKFIFDKKLDFIVVSNPMTITGALSIFFLKVSLKKYYISTDGGFIKTESFLKYILKKLILNGAQGYFYSNQPHMDYYKHYVNEKHWKFYYHHFTSIKEIDLISFDQITNFKNQSLSKHNSTHHFKVLFVGQFIHRKGIDIIERISKKLHDNNIQMIAIGGKTNNAYIKSIDFLSKSELSHYYLSCDLFFLPTREDIWGLVVNEALAHGLPVLTTKYCGAAYELIFNKNTGLMIDNLDEEKILNLIIDLKNDFELLKQYSKNSINISQDFTIEEMVRDYIKVLK
jgi:glycosyltransferase involved in cell wall biosynthesis